MEFKKQFKIILVVIGIMIFIQFLNSSIFYIKKHPKQKKESPKPKLLENFNSSNSNSNSNNRSLANPDYEGKEKQKINQTVRIKYLDKEEAFVFFNNLDYLTSMNSFNVRLRNNNNSNKSQCIQKYYKSLLDFTSQDKNFLMNLISNIFERDIAHKNKDIIKNFIAMMIPKIRFAKSNNWLESGMPHTHKNVVFLPERFFNSSKSMISKESTIIHEIFHIYQRILLKIDPQKLNTFYNHLNFIKTGYIHNFEEIRQRNRHNPDGININWNWTDPNHGGSYWIGAVFNYNTSNSIMDVKYLAYPLTKIENNHYRYEEFQKTIPLNKFYQFNKFFGIDNNHYHPNEITAQYMENLYLGEDLKNVGYQKFKNKIDSLLKMN